MVACLFDLNFIKKLKLWQKKHSKATGTSFLVHFISKCRNIGFSNRIFSNSFKWHFLCKTIRLDEDSARSAMIEYFQFIPRELWENTIKFNRSSGILQKVKKRNGSTKRKTKFGENI